MKGGIFMSDFTFDRQAAMNAGGNSYIDKSGVYTGDISKCLVMENDSGSAGIELSFEFDEGICNFVKIFTKGKDGSRIFGYDHFQALLGLLRLNSVDIQYNSDQKKCIPGVCRRRISAQMQKEEYMKKGGELGYKFTLQNFLDPDTKQTFKEKEENLEPKTSQHIIKDKLITTGFVNGTPGQASTSTPAGFSDTQVPLPLEDDLPF